MTEHSPYRCGTCDHGVLFMRHKQTKGRYAFSCNCVLGRNYPTYQKYDPSLLKDYEFEEGPKNVTSPPVFSKGGEQIPLEIANARLRYNTLLKRKKVIEEKVNAEVDKDRQHAWQTVKNQWHSIVEELTKLLAKCGEHSPDEASEGFKVEREEPNIF